jgi:hypothetical protein
MPRGSARAQFRHVPRRRHICCGTYASRRPFCGLHRTQDYHFMCSRGSSQPKATVHPRECPWSASGSDSEGVWIVQINGSILRPAPQGFHELCLSTATLLAPVAILFLYHSLLQDIHRFVEREQQRKPCFIESPALLLLKCSIAGSKRQLRRSRWVIVCGDALNSNLADFGPAEPAAYASRERTGTY